MDRIEWWLLKYSDLYKETYDFFYSQYLFELDDGTILRDPPFGKPTDKERFLAVFKALDEISEFHKNEVYFEKEMIEYNEIKKSQTTLKNWVLKNEEFGANKYACFLIDYLDYKEYDQVEHLNVCVHFFKDFEIFIDRNDFKHTIEFLENFNELYWVQEILPESIEKIVRSAN